MEKYPEAEPPEAHRGRGSGPLPPRLRPRRWARRRDRALRRPRRRQQARPPGAAERSDAWMAAAPTTAGATPGLRTVRPRGPRVSFTRRPDPLPTRRRARRGEGEKGAAAERVTGPDKQAARRTSAWRRWCRQPTAAGGGAALAYGGDTAAQVVKWAQKLGAADEALRGLERAVPVRAAAKAPEAAAATGKPPGRIAGHQRGVQGSGYAGGHLIATRSPRPLRRGLLSLIEFAYTFRMPPDPDAASRQLHQRRGPMGVGDAATSR